MLDGMTQTAAASLAGQVHDHVAVARDIVKSFGAGENEVTALRGVSAAFPRGRFTAIMGPSGSGKSTFLHCMAGLDTVTSGSILIGDVDITRLSRTRLTKLRRDRLGFVFQSFDVGVRPRGVDVRDALLEQRYRPDLEHLRDTDSVYGRPDLGGQRLCGRLAGLQRQPESGVDDPRKLPVPDRARGE